MDSTASFAPSTVLDEVQSYAGIAEMTEGAGAESKAAWLREVLGVDLHRVPGSAPGQAPSPHGEVLAFGEAEAAPGGGGSAPAHPRSAALQIRIEKLEKDGKLGAGDFDGLTPEEIEEVTALMRKKAAFLEREMEVEGRFSKVSLRFVAVIRDQSFKENAAQKGALAYQKQIKEELAAGEFDAADADITTFSAYVGEIEQLRAQRPAQQRRVAETVQKLGRLSNAQLEKLAAPERAKLIESVLEAGTPTGATRAALIRLYKHTKLDPQFVKADEAQEKKVVDALKGNRELEAARKNWNHLDSRAKTEAFKKIADAQCKAYGVPTPDIVPVDPGETTTENGFAKLADYRISDGKIHVNFAADGDSDRFNEALETILHETAHHFQAKLAEKYQRGQLHPGDPFYNQAALFAANSTDPGGNINDPTDDAEFDGYKSQPNERHAFKTSAAIAKAALRVL